MCCGYLSLFGMWCRSPSILGVTPHVLVCASRVVLVFSLPFLRCPFVRWYVWFSMSAGVFSHVCVSCCSCVFVCVATCACCGCLCLCFSGDCVCACLRACVVVNVSVSRFCCNTWLLVCGVCVVVHVVCVFIWCLRVFIVVVSQRRCLFDALCVFV